MTSVTLLFRRFTANAKLTVTSAAVFPRRTAATAASPSPKENPHHRNREKFDRDKLCVNIGTLGAAQHGKTTLTSAITRVLSQSHGAPFLDYHDIDHTPLEKESRQYQNVVH